MESPKVNSLAGGKPSGIKWFILAIVLLGIIMATLVYTCGPKNYLHELPEGYDTIIYVNNPDVNKPIYVKDYSITNGVLTVNDYYYTYYSVAPTDDYFIHTTEQITTSMFTLKLRDKKDN